MELEGCLEGVPSIVVVVGGQEVKEDQARVDHHGVTDVDGFR